MPEVYELNIMTHIHTTYVHVHAYKTSESAKIKEINQLKSTRKAVRSGPPR